MEELKAVRLQVARVPAKSGEHGHTAARRWSGSRHVRTKRGLAGADLVLCWPEVAAEPVDEAPAVARSSHMAEGRRRWSDGIGSGQGGGALAWRGFKTGMMLFFRRSNGLVVPPIGATELGLVPWGLLD